MRLVTSTVRQKVGSWRNYFIWITVLCIVGIAYLNFFGESPEQVDDVANTSAPFSISPRVQAYCHSSVPLENSSLSNSVEAELLELQRLVITIRHGDRSAIHKLPNAVIAKNSAQQLFRPEVKSYLGHLDKIKLAPEPSKNPLAPKVQLNDHIYGKIPYINNQLLTK
ncbi:hypothetical protein EON65_48390 [archaeon]|nr:MAG: hypothetical protein EON65_48390 [archaeon]